MSDEKRVDESWKEKAKAEQGRPAANPAEAPQGGGGPHRAEARQSEGGLHRAEARQSEGGPHRAEARQSEGGPPADFNSLVLSLATGAFLALGLEAEEEGKPRPPDLPRARTSIDLLEMLAAKTKGNLAPDEDRRLAAILHQLRMAYVDAARARP